MMKKALLIVLVLMFGSLGFGATASAQDVTCSDIVWSDTALGVNPNIADYCLDIVEKNGQQMAKMTARVVRQSVNSTIVQWQRPDGSWSPSERRYPDRGFRAHIGDDEVRISDLPARQEVNVYVAAEDMWSLPAAAPMAAAAAPAAAPAPAPEPEPEPEPAPAMLPTTATQLPLLALLGGLMVLLGGAVSLVRSRM
jgi:hypothetical protein